jgi:hypothetical protein
LTKEVSMLAGHQEFPPKFLVKAMDRLADQVIFLSLASGLDTQVFDMSGPAFTYFALDTMRRLRNQPIKGESFELGNLITFGRGREATDPRDRAYDLFGLAKDVNSTSFHVDYSRPIGSLSARVARFLVNIGHGMLMPTHADGCRRHWGSTSFLGF